MSVDLPAPDGPTRNTKSPSGTTRSTSLSASLPFGIALRDVVQDDDRVDRAGSGRARPVSRSNSDGGTSRERGRARLDGHRNALQGATIHRRLASVRRRLPGDRPAAAQTDRQRDRQVAVESGGRVATSR